MARVIRGLLVVWYGGNIRERLGGGEHGRGEWRRGERNDLGLEC